MYPIGNYCGPYWSAGKIQRSVQDDYVPALSSLDNACRNHDAKYANDEDLTQADIQFAREAWSEGFFGKLFSAAVLSNIPVRAIDNKFRSLSTLLSMTKLRGSKSANVQGAQQQQQQKKKKASQASGVKQVTVPVAIGSTIRSVKPAITRNLDSTRVVGRDFVASVEAQGVSAFGIGKSAMLSPAYFNTTQLGNLARSFEKYRWNRLRIHYIPKVSTTATGQVVLCSSKSVTLPCLQPESGVFLQRAMSQGNACFTPLWQNAYIDIDCDSTWCLCDAAAGVDLDDNIHEELQVYSQAGVSGQVGYLIAEYDITFKEPLYSMHAAAIPYPTGPGLRVACIDAAGINAVGDDWLISNATLAAQPNGTIFRAVFDLQGSDTPVGATFANAFNTTTSYRTAITTSATTTNALPLVGGTALYLVVVATGLYVYTSMEAAINGNGSGQVFFRTATTASGVYWFDVAFVRHGAVALPSMN